MQFFYFLLLTYNFLDRAFCHMRAPLEHLVLTEKIALVHDYYSFHRVGVGLSHRGKVEGLEIFSVDEEVKESLGAWVRREFCFEFPPKSVLHHGDWEGLLHFLALENLGALQLFISRCLDGHHSRLRADIKTDFNGHHFSFLAFL